MTGSEDRKLFYSVVGRNIKKYRDIRNYSLQILAEKVGITKKTVQRYENGEHKFDMDRLKDLATALDVTVNQLTEGAYTYTGNEIQDSEYISLPVVGKISCGNGQLAYESIEGYETTPRSWINGGEYFYLRAKGDSMNGARIFEGDLLLIRKQEEVEDGEIAAVLIDDEAVLKKVYVQNNTLILQSTNPNYPPIIFTGDNSNIRIIGKLKKVVINF
ncbi:LexA family protein [Paenibacillus donghaensis]|uniref:LexA family transcriptional repressor n=1 Tax=Paenibacillus donghaensis TaxID=414771 RepID=A0A2Z2KII3_9BACL|nr:XRE family transcriptional regulator [Paenibacillus donghaensis]ASA22049.1 LexA family transcriptional repressor [Paenibacillus donghaensis]